MQRSRSTVIVLVGDDGRATGPWWPALDRLRDGVERAVPDRAGLDIGRPGLEVGRQSS